MKNLLRIFMIVFLASGSSYAQSNLQGVIFGSRDPNAFSVRPDTVGVPRFKYFHYGLEKLYNWNDSTSIWVEDSIHQLTVDVKSFKSHGQYLRNYKIYKALITQYSTDDPTAIVLENSIGDISWARVSAGIYRANLTGAFTSDKTWLVTQADNDSNWYCYRYDADFIYCRADSDGVIDDLSIEIGVYY